MPRFVFPANDQASFLKLAYTLENVGVGAYNGAGPALQNKRFLAAAGTGEHQRGYHDRYDCDENPGFATHLPYLLGCPRPGISLEVTPL